MPYRWVDARAAAADLVRNWLKQYDNRHIYVAQALRALPENPTPDQVDEAFASCAPHAGHTNRVQREFSCEECGGTFDALVQIDANAAEHYLHLCVYCVLKLVKFVQ
jgi:hypothetical protein